MQEFESNFPQSFRDPVTNRFPFWPRRVEATPEQKNLPDATNTFGRLLLTAGENDVDMKVVLRDYEFVPSAPALFHKDGGMRSCAKHQLKKLLQS